MALENVKDFCDLQKTKPNTILTRKEHNITGGENEDLFLEYFVFDS
jgi:hypothetical protein